MARREGVLVAEIGDELLVFDSERSRAHSLNRTAAAVWRACDGTRDVDALAVECGADRETVRLALDRLRGVHLLADDGLPVVMVSGEAAGVSRRAMLRKSVVAGAGVGLAIPVIRSITAPTLAMAATNGRVKGKAGQHCGGGVRCSPGSFCNSSTNFHSCQRLAGASCSHTSSCLHLHKPGFGLSRWELRAMYRQQSMPGQPPLVQRRHLLLDLAWRRDPPHHLGLGRPARRG